MHNVNFETVEDFEAHWLFSDSLYSVKQDLEFSMGTRYYCDAGCHVCYIAKNLKAMKSTISQYFPKMTDRHEEMWESVFDHFLYLHTDDDMMFLKLNHPPQYEWFKRNAYRFHYGMTDNAIFRYSNSIIKDVKFKLINNVSISSSFANRVNKDKLLNALNLMNDTIGIKQIKLIAIGTDIDILQFYDDFAKSKGMQVLYHYDMNHERLLLKKPWVTEQITWIDTNPNNEDGIMQVYGNEAVQLCFDRFYFSNEASSGTDIEPYHVLTDKFDPEKFLYDLVIGKQTLYNQWYSITKNERFKTYYNTVSQYVFQEDYNFIPGHMMPPRTKFCAKLKEIGWTQIPLGLYKPTDSGIKSFIGKK